MSDVLSRKNALLGWAVWNLAKRRLRREVRAEGSPPRRRKILRVITVVAVLAALAGVLAKRATGPGDSPE